MNGVIAEGAQSLKTIGEEGAGNYSAGFVDGYDLNKGAIMGLSDGTVKQLQDGKWVEVGKWSVNQYAKGIKENTNIAEKAAAKLGEPVGSSLDEGIASGVGDAKKAVGAVNGAVGKVMGAWYSGFEINSPSKKTKEVGEYLVEGIQFGINSKWRNFSAFLLKKIDEIIKKFNPIKAKFTEKGNDVVTGLNLGVSTKWSGFESFLKLKKSSMVDVFKTIKESFDNKGADIIKGIKGGINGEWPGFKTYWKEKKGYIVDQFNGIKDSFRLKGNSIVEGLQSGISEKWGLFSSFFEGKMKNVVEGIAKSVNWVLKEVGSNTRINESWSGFARGSKGIPKDTVGMVNDQKGSVYRELILPPDRKPFIPKGRNVMLQLKKGTKIMPAFETKKFMKNMPHFAGGIGDFFGSAWAKIQEFTGNIMDYITNPSKILQIALDKFVSLAGIAEPVLSIAKGTVNTILGGATDFIQKMFDEELVVKYDPSKGVEQWRGLASKALQMTHQFTESNLNALLNQMRTESSGNPRAINLWDANARKGTPSKGLMQVLDSTFRSYAYPGFDKDIWDPLSNMLASIRYALAIYGSLAKAYQGHAYKLGIGKIQYSDIIQGYATGGYPRRGDLFLANENGNPEMVGRMGNHTAVANNSQIAEGFAEAIYPAVYNAVSSAMRNNKNSTDVTFKVEGDPNGLFRVTRKKAREYYDRTKKQAFDF